MIDQTGTKPADRHVEKAVALFVAWNEAGFTKAGTPRVAINDLAHALQQAENEALERAAVMFNRDRDAPCGCCDPHGADIDYGCECGNPGDTKAEAEYWADVSAARLIRAMKSESPTMSTEKQHTPGEWFWSGRHLMETRADGISSEHVLEVGPGHYDMPSNDRANLIQSAPALLAALKLQVRCMNGDGDLQTFLHMRDAAIAKAEGRS